MIKPDARTAVWYATFGASVARLANRSADINGATLVGDAVWRRIVTLSIMVADGAQLALAQRDREPG